ncbi:MMPL family transporter [Nocardioides nanhaiensis]|uniref:MMPL family transporter n=1 Tax=Nocardioides nanhaiensis TaxID=1476871 RepID=A0ABP8WEF1_9ACTN
MATFLQRLGSAAYRRWPVVVAAWLVALIGVGALAAGFSKPMSDTFSIPGIPSERAATLQQELFPTAVDAFDQASVTVVVQAPQGQQLSDPAVAEQVGELVAALQGLPQMPPADVAPLADPVTAAQAQREQLVGAAVEGGTPEEVAQANADALSPLSEDGTTGLIPFTFDVDTVADVEPATVEALTDVMDDAREGGLTVEANGSGLQTIPHLGGTSELIGIGVALVVLVLTFGSLVAAGLPILTALFGVGIGVAGITAATAFTDIGSTTPLLATMIGLAVGIDYTLFILARYRSELEHTDDRRQAIGIAVGTAGSAVVFAGLTVLIALSALSVVRIPFLTSMGIAAAVTVLIAVLVALTLLPAVLGMLGKRSFGGVVRRYRPTRDAEGRVLNNGVRWARLLGKRPVAVVLLVVVGLGALALPIRDLYLAFPTDSTASSDTTQRQASDLIAAEFGPGRDAPLAVVVDARGLDEEQAGAAFGAVAEWAGGQDGVANAQVVATNAPLGADGAPTGPATGAQVLVTPATGAEDQDTEEVLQALRDGQSGIEEETGTEIGVTGLTAITVDVSERLASALPIYLAIVVGLAFILLMIVFRSILVPLTATLGFLLSVLATLGLTVLIFQEGALGLMEGQPIVSFIPIFLIGLVFGLAMDYQVFLVTRMREAHVHGMGTREAVVDGFRNSARVVTAAAVIMISVFAAFILIDDPIIKSMGFALAVAVFLDAFVVRMTLIPALMYLLGEKAWWLPRWLDRLLPNVDVEGEKLERPAGSTGRRDPDAGSGAGDREPVSAGV